MISKIYVSEVEISRIKKGQIANITVDAFPLNTYTGKVIAVGNIGEKLPNTDSKVFEVLIRLDGTDSNLRPSMTTNNKIIISTYDDVKYLPIECVHTGPDSIPVVYTRNRNKAVVEMGETNDKFVIITEGPEVGTRIWIEVPEDARKYKLQE
jgi:hypothetical protein